MKIEISKKYKTKSGMPVKILAVSENPLSTAHTICGIVFYGSGSERFVTWGIDGTYYENGNSSPLDLVEVSPYEDWKINDRVICYDSMGRQYRRYFAGLDERGEPTTYLDGATSWSSGENPLTSTWTKMELFVEPTT